MTHFNSTPRLRGRSLAMSLSALLAFAACAGDEKPTTHQDASPPGSVIPDAASSAVADATAPTLGDAGSVAPNDAGAPSVADAAAGPTLDAGEPDAAPPSTSDGSVDDAMPADAATTAARPLSTSLMLPTTKESPGVEPIFDVYQPADLASAVAATGRALPVIVWANGGCLRSAPPWEPLYKRWAAAGFVVLALSVKPGGSIFDALAGTTQVEHGKQLDWVLEQAQKPGSPYAGKIDTGMVVAAGNSCGGVTAMELAAKDARVRTVFVLSGSSAVGSANTTVVKAIKAPVGFVVGNAEQDIAAPNALMDYQMLTVPSMIVNRSMGDHLTVSTDAMILPQVAEIALNWMDLTLYGNKQASAALKAPNVCNSCTPGSWKLQSKQLETLEK